MKVDDLARTVKIWHPLRLNQFAWKRDQGPLVWGSVLPKDHV